MLVGCSTMEIEPAASSDDLTQEILAKGLSHEDNLKEAGKLGDPHLVKIVTLKLKNDRDKKIQGLIDDEKSEEFANQVKVSGESSIFTSLEINESLQSGLLSTNMDHLKYYFVGKQNKETESIEHKLHLSLVYNSKSSRDYKAVSFCDQWNNCQESTMVKVISVSGSNCSSASCDFKEVFEIDLTDDFLKSTVMSGFSMRLISKDKTNIIKIPKAYLMGYLKIAK